DLHPGPCLLTLPEISWRQGLGCHLWRMVWPKLVGHSHGAGYLFCHLVKCHEGGGQSGTLRIIEPAARLAVAGCSLGMVRCLVGQYFDSGLEALSGGEGKRRNKGRGIGTAGG